MEPLKLKKPTKTKTPNQKLPRRPQPDSSTPSVSDSLHSTDHDESPRDL